MICPHPATSLTIRPMHWADLDQVHAIDQLSFSMPWPASAYKYELTENPSSLLWVAEVVSPQGSRQVVGLIVVWLIVDQAHIATLAVHPTHRREGIAKRLLAAALKASAQRGLKEATLEVRLNNLAAQNLYRRFGFQVAGQRPRYYQDNQEDALIMTLYNLGEDYLAWLESEAWAHSGNTADDTDAKPDN